MVDPLQTNLSPEPFPVCMDQFIIEMIWQMQDNGVSIVQSCKWRHKLWRWQQPGVAKGQ